MTTILMEEEHEVMADTDLRRDLRIESLLREWNIPFEFDQDFPVGKLDADYNDSQVREVNHRAPQENVNEYAIQMRAGAIFPPMVATHNRRLIDGNTRKGACETNGVETFPVYLVKLPQASYGPMIGAALNQMGGKRLTDEEAFAAAETMIRNGHADEAIARTLGKSARSIRNYRRQTRYKDAAERTGVSEVKVTATAQRALAGIKLDEPFKEAVQLVSAVKLPPRDVQDLVEKIESTHSETQALEVIEEVRQACAGRAAAAEAEPDEGCDCRRPQGRCVPGSVKVPADELAPATLRTDLEPKWKQLHELAGAVLLAFAENAPPELTETHGGIVSTDESRPQPGEDAGLGSLGRYRGGGMSTTMQNVFDVLYEAGEPLNPETIAQRTYERASGAASSTPAEPSFANASGTGNRPPRICRLSGPRQSTGDSGRGGLADVVKKLLRDARTRNARPGRVQQVRPESR